MADMPDIVAIRRRLAHVRQAAARADVQRDENAREDWFTTVRISQRDVVDLLELLEGTLLSGINPVAALELESITAPPPSTPSFSYAIPSATAMKAALEERAKVLIRALNGCTYYDPGEDSADLDEDQALPIIVAALGGGG